MMQPARVMSFRDFLLEEINEMLAEEGRDVKLVREGELPRGRPKLVVDNEERA